MEERRIGGIAMAVTLAVLTAFAAIMLLFLNQSVSIAAKYAESSTGLCSSELLSQLVSYAKEESLLVSSGLLDEELVAVLEREHQGLSSQETLSQALPLLERLTVGDSKNVASLASARSHVVYRSDGTMLNADGGGIDTAWLNALMFGTSRTMTTSWHVKDRSAVQDENNAVLMGHRLVHDEQAVGAVCIGVGEQGLSSVMDDCLSGQDQQAICFAPDGAVLFAESDANVTSGNVFELYPAISSLSGELKPQASQRWRVWTNLEGLLPQGQCLYEVRYCEEFDSYLLTINTAQNIFNEMRSRSTVLILALSVVMVLLVLLVVSSVRIYRTRIIRMATTDELTGLANRKSFAAGYQRLAQRENAPASTLALIDVDRFKQVNDTYGHAGGDCALAAIAAEVRTLVGRDGMGGRWGGDEFIALIPCAGSDAQMQVDQMIARVAALRLEGDIRVSVSVGTTDVDWSLPLERMVEQADDALYVTKEGGRGFLTVYEPGVTPHMVEAGRTVGAERTTGARVEQAPPASSSHLSDIVRDARVLDLVVASLLEAVRRMVPFVAGGGILIAIAFLIDGASVDVNQLSSEARANFGSITPLAAGLRDVGSAAFNFMLPIFAAFFARGLAGDEAFMAGFAGGYLASQGSAGFAGAICAAIVAALVVRLMKNFIDETPATVKRVAPVLLYPVFSLLIMYLLMRYLIDPFASRFDALLTAMLVRLQDGSRVVLGAVCGAMMATDMGGPINKAAYHFGVNAIASGSPDIMASVMVGGMVPPCGIALSMLLFRDCYSDQEHDTGPATLFMGLSFITEGAIPFLLTDVLRVIPSCMLGAGLSGALSEAYGCKLMAPHGGIFVFPVVGNAMMYLVALIAGSLATALALGLSKRVGRGLATTGVS